jgi:hypothetical protein
LILCVPPLDEPEWPTLGPAVWRWMRRNLCYGPGDLLGQPIKEDLEWFAILCRLYQVWPQGHEWAGRRRFKRGVISRRKGRAKTELAAWISAAELHPRAPVRCIGWTAKGNPRGGPVADPYIPLVAYTEEQGETTIYGALKAILERSEVARDFDIGLERIMRADGSGGRAEALAAEPSARDGARTTFQVFEETHRWSTPRLKRAYQTMMANIPKRRTADAWSLEVTTSFAPGEGSIAEHSLEHARAVADGRLKDSRLFFSHRQAPDDADISTPEGLRAAVVEASGEVAAEWSDIESICAQFDDPNLDPSTLRRLWLNQIVRPTDKAFDSERWASLKVERGLPAKGAVIVLGFDGARSDDATALIGTEVVSGYQFRLGLWERPQGEEDWTVPIGEVVEALEWAFSQWTVWRGYFDPPYWETPVNEWAGRWGDKVIVRWYTNQMRKMAYALRAFCSALADGSLTHDGDADVSRHIANAYRKTLQQRDEEGAALWVIQKEAKMSPLKIDAAMGSVLSWQCRLDALADGQGQVPGDGRIYVFGETQAEAEEEELEPAW